ncbi:MAG: hypothetical protein ACYC6T_11245 [Thermoleophilia bacterium]
MLQHIIGRWLGAGVSLFLLAGAFFSSQDRVFAAWIVGLWLPVVAVVTVAAALLLPELAGAMTFITRFTALGAAAVALIQGGRGAAVALALVAAVMWGAYWIAGRRVAGRSISGVFRDMRYEVEGVAKQ